MRIIIFDKVSGESKLGYLVKVFAEMLQENKASKTFRTCVFLLQIIFTFKIRLHTEVQNIFQKE